MKKYLPWIIIVTLMLVSGAVIYARGGFNEERKIETAMVTPTPTLTPIPTSPPTLAPRKTPVVAPTPISTIPSIIRRGGEDD